MAILSTVLDQTLNSVLFNPYDIIIHADVDGILVLHLLVEPAGIHLLRV